MNTRIQVEHPVTELLTGLDLVREQIRIAAGEPLGYQQDAIQLQRATPSSAGSTPRTRRPSPRRRAASPPGCRRAGPRSAWTATSWRGYVVPPHYDSLVAKIIVHGTDRAEAIARMQRALAETVVEGIKTTIPYHLKLLADPAFVPGEFTLPRLEQSL